MGLFDEMKKARKRLTLGMNQTRGAMAEQGYVARRTLQGYDVRRTGQGSDYSEQKVNWLTGRKSPKSLVEVKSGDAHLSELQERTKKRTRNYREERY